MITLQQATAMFDAIETAKLEREFAASQPPKQREPMLYSVTEKSADGDLLTGRILLEDELIEAYPWLERFETSICHDNFSLDMVVGIVRIRIEQIV